MNLSIENPWLFWSLTLAFYLWHTFGVTVGLHRLLAHRAFRCHKAVEYFLVFGAYLAFHGSPVWWATIHRTHHRFVDTDLDPHSPSNGIFQAYAFFRKFEYPAHIDPHRQSPDLLKDPIYKFLESRGDWRWGYALCVGISILYRVALFFCFGKDVAIASLIAGVAALNVPLIFNIVSHIPRLGYKNFDIEDNSVNVWLFAILALGDGWHNNHHAYPASSQMGVLKHEFDASWFFLKVLQRVGLVYTINESMPRELPKAAAETAAEPETATEPETKVLVGLK